MTLRRLIWRSLVFFRAPHLAAAAGIAVAAAVITGALVVGDSVRGTLRTKALHRTAGAHYAISSGDHFFREDLATVHPSAVPILMLPGSVRHGAKHFRANDVQIVGITTKYFALSGLQGPPLPPDRALLSPELAKQLGAATGDEVVLRMRKPGEIAGEAAISPGKTATVGWRVRVAGVLDDKYGGNLNLRGSGLEAHNVFLPIESVAAEINRPGKANALLIGGPARGADPISIPELYDNLATHWTLEDAGIEIKTLVDGSRVVQSSQIFLPDEVVRAAQQAANNSLPVLTYLANLIQCGTNVTPYSMITAAGPPYTPPDMRDDEIVLSSWLAEDLAAKPGDLVHLSYYIPDSGAQLLQATNRFTVRVITPMTPPHADRSLMPEFPGIREAERTHDWDAGFPLDYDIRDKDEAYWKEYRGTPKAFITYAAGQKIWQNRFGIATSVRIAASGATAKQLETNLLAKLSPAQSGFTIRDLRSEGRAAANNAQDFGQLFIAFSVFIIVSALMLIWLLLQFGLESRVEEAGALLALGFDTRRLRKIYASETLLVALVGTLVGIIVGLLYAKGLLWGLGTVWRGAVGGALLDLHLSVSSLLLGAAISLLLSGAVAWLVIRQISRRAGRELLSAEIEPQKGERWTRLAASLGAICLLAALALLAVGLFSGEPRAGIFFGAGSLLLITGWATFWHMQQHRRADPAVHSWRGLVLQAGARRPRRSLAAVALLSCGCFVIVAVSGFRLPNITGPPQRISGTGGFDTLASASLPILHDPSTAEGRQALGLDFATNEVRIVPLRMNDGDEASCLNLNRAIRPRLLGVNPALLHGRFKFTSGPSAAAQWELLHDIKTAPDGTLEVPAIGDANSVRWSMGKGLGQSLALPDGNGRAVRFKVVATLENSVLQGSLVISEKAFLRIFPQTAGYRFFLMETLTGDPGETTEALTSAMEDFGVEAVPASRRLSALNSVQNTYLSTFQFLGGIGLLVGSVGLGLLVLRNVMERRSELAVMTATGFSRKRVLQLILEEHLLLLMAGLLIGSIAALAAIAPALCGHDVASAFLATTLAIVMLNGVAWTVGAALFAVRGSILGALRKE